MKEQLTKTARTSGNYIYIKATNVDCNIDEEKYFEIIDADLEDASDGEYTFEIIEGQTIYREYDGVGNIEYQKEF